MIEVRFHAELYDGSAIDEAVQVYAPYAAIALAREEGGITVKIEPSPGEDAADPAIVAAELMNYALGKTIERSRAVAEGAASQGATS